MDQQPSPPPPRTAYWAAVAVLFVVLGFITIWVWLIVNRGGGCS